MHKNILNFLFFFKFTVIMCLTTEVFSPSFGSFRVSASKFDDSFNLVNFLAHASVQLYLHRV